MRQFLDLMQEIIDDGHDHSDRTGVGRRSIISKELTFDLSDNKLPMVTTRKINFPVIIRELIWFIRGSSNVQELHDLGVKFWDQWAVTEQSIKDFIEKYLGSTEDEVILNSLTQELERQYKGSIGPLYGPSWRNIPLKKVHKLWPSLNIPYEDIASDARELFSKQYEEIRFMMQGKFEGENGEQQEFPSLETFSQHMYSEYVDQLNNLILGLRDRPWSSRHVVSAWIPEYIPFETLSPEENVLLGKAALAPCHAFFQCFVSPPKEKGGKPRLSLKLTQRSADVPVGVTVNIPQYSLLTHLLAHILGYEADKFIWSGGDVHIYANQSEGVIEQLKREPYPTPTIKINPDLKSIYELKESDVELIGYEHHPHIAYPIAK